MSTTTSDAQMQYNPSATSGYSQDVLGGPVLTTDTLIDAIIRFIIDVGQRTLSTPAERLKLLTTVEGELKRQGRLPSQKGFRGILGCIRRVWSNEGALGFFRGAATDVMLSLPAGFVDALSMNIVFRISQVVLGGRFSNTMNMGTAVTITMGMTAFAVFVATPYFSLRRSILTNFMADIVAPGPFIDSTSSNVGQSNEDSEEVEKGEKKSATKEAYLYNSATETVQSIYRRQGLRAFYRGALIPPMLATVYRGLYLGAAMLLPGELQQAHPYCVLSALSLVSDVLMQPLEVLERRLSLCASDDVAPPYKGILDCARTIVKNEGVCTLWAGLRCRIVLNSFALMIRVMMANLFAES